MKFVQIGDKHQEIDCFDEEYEREETTPPRHIPSYYNIVRKENKKNSPG